VDSAGVRNATFRETLKGYDRREVDDLLRRIAAAIDTGHSPHQLIANARFRDVWKGYDRDDVDDFLNQLQRQATGDPDRGPWSQAPGSNSHDATARLPGELHRDASDPSPTSSTRSTWVPRRPAFCVLMLLFIGFGLYLADVGFVIWSDAHHPQAIATVEHKRCWVSEGDDGSTRLCDLRVAYTADGHATRSTMKAVTASYLYGPPASQLLAVTYDPSAPTDAAAADDASTGLAYGMWAAAIAFIGLSARLIRKSWPHLYPHAAPHSD